MVLVDTSVWGEHLRSGNIGLEGLLNDGDVVCHPFIIGELACGNIRIPASGAPPCAPGGR